MIELETNQTHLSFPSPLLDMSVPTTVRSAAASLLSQLRVPDAVSRRALSAVEIADDPQTLAFLDAFQQISPVKMWEPAAAVNVAIAGLIAAIIEQAQSKLPRMRSSPAHSVLQLVSQHHITLHGPNGQIEEFDRDILAKVIKQGGYGSVLTGLYKFPKDGRYVFLHKSMSVRQTLEVLGFTKADQAKFRQLDVKDKPAAKQMLLDKVAATGWTAAEAEAALWKNGACTGMVRTREECLQTPQGKALASMPLAVVETLPAAGSPPAAAALSSDSAPLRRPKLGTDPLRPLAGLNVVDMSRILAGPAASKLLASLGANVLKLSSPKVPDIDVFIMDTGLGKRSAFLDLKNEAQKQKFFDEILPEMDVIIQGYRTGKLEALGLGFKDLAKRVDALITSGKRSPDRPLYYLSENCFGPAGTPLAHLGGWEQIAQVFTGLSLPIGPPTSAPRMLPLTILDLLTGQTLALSALSALLQPPTHHYNIQTSLAQTAFFIQSFGLRSNFDLSKVPVELTNPESDVASMTPHLLHHLNPQLAPLLANNPAWFGQHPHSPRGHLGFLRPAFGMVTDNGDVFGRWRWSSRVNGHDELGWVGDEVEGDGDREVGGRVRWVGEERRANL